MDDDRASYGRWGWSAILHGHEPESRELRAGLVRIGQLSLLPSMEAVDFRNKEKGLGAFVGLGRGRVRFFFLVFDRIPILFSLFSAIWYIPIRLLVKFEVKTKNENQKK